jgi:RNA polymerase sigma-70 factor (ECF subfamily)
MGTRVVRFETLIEQHHDEIYSYLWRLLDGARQIDHLASAEDLAQEVFLRAYQGFERLRPDSNYRAWLYKIATNCAYTALKRGKRHVAQCVRLTDEEEQFQVDSGPGPYQAAVQQETLEAVNRKLGQLSSKQQAAVILRHVQGLDYGEIAQALNCSEESARANVYQGLKSLRRALGDENEFYEEARIGGSQEFVS